MLITETFYIGSREFIRTRSDAGKYVVRNGVSYTEACDPAEFQRQYEEGELIPDMEPSLIEKAQAYDILTGVNE